MARAMDKAEVKAGCEASFRLSGQLDAFRLAPSTETAVEIRNARAWSEDACQATDLRKAVQYHYAQPNIILHVSAERSAAGLASRVDESLPSQEVILETSVQSSNRVLEHISVALTANPQCGEFDVACGGTTTSTNTGCHHAGARISSVAITQAEVQKHSQHDATRIWASPAVVQAKTQTTINGGDSGHGPRGQKEAWNRVRQELPQAEAIAAQRMEEQTARRMDEEAGRIVEPLNRRYDAAFRRPAQDRGICPQCLELHPVQWNCDRGWMVLARKRSGAPRQTKPPSRRSHSDRCIARPSLAQYTPSDLLGTKDSAAP